MATNARRHREIRPAALRTVVPWWPECSKMRHGKMEIPFPVSGPILRYTYGGQDDRDDTPAMSISRTIFASRFLFWPPFWCNLVEGQRSRRSPSFRADSAALLPGSALSADCRARSDENSGDSPRRPRRRKATSALSADLRFRRTVSGAGERRKLDPTKSGCRRQPCAPASSPRRCT